MSTQYTPFTLEDIDAVLAPQGFKVLVLQGVREVVYAKGQRIAGVSYSIRVYTTVENGVSRLAGGDSIKVVVLAKYASGTPKALGSEIRVHRTQGWRENLQSRLNNWQSMIPTYVEGVKCPNCGSPMVKKNSAKGEFYGCADFPTCRGIVNPGKPVSGRDAQGCDDLFRLVPSRESVNLPGIINLFNTSAAHLKFPKIVFEVNGQTIKLSLAGSNSKNRGSVNITDGREFGNNTYFGRISPAGVLIARDELTAEIREFLIALSTTPVETIDAYGKKTGCCMFCSTPLTRSAVYGWGEICAQHWGLPYDKALVRKHAKHLAAQARNGQELVQLQAE